MNITNVLLVVLVVIIIICFVAKYCQTNKLKENLTMTVTQSKSTSSKTLPEASGTMPHLDNSNSSCGQPLYSCPPSYNSSSCHLPVQKTALNSSPGCVDSECHKSMVGLFGNLFKNLPSVDKLPHITHTLQITPKKTQSVSTAASVAASQHGSSIAPAQSSPASVPPSSSPLKSITTAAECTAAGGKGFNYCPETGKYYCCGVDASKGYEVCGGTDGACPSNSGLKDCVCPSNLSSTPASVPPSVANTPSSSSSSSSSSKSSSSSSSKSSSSSSSKSSSSSSSKSSSSSALKSITTAAECTAAGGKDFNYCPETGKYYCCGVDASKGYEVCGGTDGICPSNSGLQNCVCSSDNTYTPIGAFIDNVNGVRAMNKTISIEQNYSAEKCSTACNGYKYFGLQDPGTGGSQCFCSNSLHETTQFGPYTSKSPKCEYKGAPGCNYVYKKNSPTSKAPAATKSYSPIGAFKDTSNRAMSSTWVQLKNADECSAHCKDSDYFGLQDPDGTTTSCFCSNNLHETTKYGPYTSTNPSCGPYGAPWCNYVYKNK